MPELVTREEMRYQAVDAISDVHPPPEVILPFLSGALQGSNDIQYRQAISILGQINHGGAALERYFKQGLHSPDAEVQKTSLTGIESLGVAGKGTLPDLIDMLGRTNVDENERFNVINILGEMGKEAAPAIPGLRKLFENETNWFQRSRIATSLCRIDAGQTNALNFLIAGLEDEESGDHRPPAVPAYQLPGSPAMPGYESQREDTFAQAATALGELGSNAQPAIPMLIEALKGTNATWDIAEALKNIGAPAESYLPLIRLRLSSSNDWERLQAAKTILEIIPGDCESQLAMIGLIKKDSSWNVDAIIELGEVRTNVLGEVIPTISGVLDERGTRGLTEAVTALRNLHAPADLYLPKLKARIKTISDTVKMAGGKAILEIDPSDEDGIRCLMDLVRKKSALASEAVAALGEAGLRNKAVAPFLREAFGSSDKNVRRAAGKALRKSGEEGAW
jgi:HEAT repeat protein